MCNILYIYYCLNIFNYDYKGSAMPFIIYEPHNDLQCIKSIQMSFHNKNFRTSITLSCIQNVTSD